MKKITFLLFTICAFAFNANAQINVSDTPGLAITDNTPAGVTTDIVVGPTTGTITDITVDLDIQHTWNGDLIVTLTAPDLTVITLVDRPGVPATGVGCNDDGMQINLADGNPGNTETCILSGAPYPAVTGNYAPLNPLSGFDGKDATGTWTLFVSDNAAGDNGIIVAWGMNISGPVLGLENNVIQGFNYSPNPVKDVLNLRAANNIEMVSVYNLLGQEVMREMPKAITSNLSMSHLNSGAYFVKVSVGDQTQTVRVLKQ